MTAQDRKERQGYRIGSLTKRTYINENRHENGIGNYIGK